MHDAAPRRDGPSCLRVVFLRRVQKRRRERFFSVSDLGHHTPQLCVICRYDSAAMCIDTVDVALPLRDRCATNAKMSFMVAGHDVFKP